MTTKKYKYVYIERAVGKPDSDGVLYAKMFSTYEEAKTLFDHIVNDVEQRNGSFQKPTMDVPDCFLGVGGIQFEITTNL